MASTSTRLSSSVNPFFISFVLPFLYLMVKRNTGRDAQLRHSVATMTSHSPVYAFIVHPQTALDTRAFAKKQTNSFSGILQPFFRVFCLLNRIFAPRLGLFGAFFAFSPFFSPSPYLKPLWTLPRFLSAVFRLFAFILLTAQQFCRIMPPPNP